MFSLFPAETPVTPEEKAKAAAKYGMIPEDYEPYGETEEGKYYNLGDYPKIKPRGGDERPGYINYDYVWLKRDFGELHIIKLILVKPLKKVQDIPFFD